MIQDEEQRNTIGASIFAVLMGLAAVCLVGWVMLSGSCTDSRDARIADSTAATEAIAVIAPAISDTEEIETSEAYMKLVTERDRIAGERLEAVSKGREAEKELERLKRKFGSLEAENAESSKKTALLGTAAASAAALKLQADNAAQRADALEGEIGTLKARISALEKAAADAKASVEGLKGDLDKSVSAKNQLQSAKGELETKVAALDAERTKLSGTVTALEAKLAEAQKAAKAQMASAETKSALDQKVESLNVELAAAKKAAADAKKASTEAQAAMKAKEAEFAKQLAEAQAKSKQMAAAGNESADEKAKALTAQLEALRKKHGVDSKSWAAEKERLVASVKKLSEKETKLDAAVMTQDTEIDRLKKLLEEQKAAAAMAAASTSATPSQPALDLPLLVNDPSQLAAYSQPLFTKLNTIDENEASRKQVYAELKAAGEVDPKLTIPFRSGSATVGSDDLSQINSLIADAGEGAKFLVVGYASTDGSAEGNRKLSSERASNVAQRIAEKLGEQGTEHVQAIYFGQTTRFSDSRKTPNRVVEVWKVK